MSVRLTTVLWRPVRLGWRRLISMRTALVLLFLLAVAAVPASLLPQRPLNANSTRAYLASHGAWGQLLNHIGAFDVFGSVWFAAIYLLLLISLIGCLIPRIRAHYRAARSRPPRTPRHLDRLPEYRRLSSGLPLSQATTQARTALRGYRVDVRPAGDVVEIAAEKGYVRETGNLIFHLGLLAALVLIVIGRLWHYEGTILLGENQGFCNSVLNYDSFRAGRLAQNGQVAPFCVDNLNSFTATYRDDGSASSFDADITYSLGANGAPRHDNLRVNHPLRISGDRLYLLGHGFSPVITVRMPDGSVRRNVDAAFLPQDSLFTSEGAFTLQGRRCATGSGTDVGLSGVFAPSGVQRTPGVVSSASPQPVHPVLAILAYEGDLGLCNGQPRSVYTLDPVQIASGKLKQVGKANLAIGQTLTLPGGGAVTFTGYRQWVSLQVSHDPTQFWLLPTVIAMIAGLIASLVVRRRRLWLRLQRGEEDSAEVTVIEVAGLGRSDAGDFPAEFGKIVAHLHTATTTAQDKARQVVT
jgi:cytochrome c biogenesis protein